MPDQPTHKIVDGVKVPLTPQEIAEIETSAIVSVQQKNLSTPDPGYGKTIRETLTPPMRGPF